MNTERLSTLTHTYDMDSKAHAFVQWAACLAAADGSKAQALETFQLRYPRSSHLALLQKSAVAVATTTDSSWAAPLLGPLSTAFLELLRPRTVIGQLTAAKRVPLNVRVISQLTGTTAGWIAEGKPIPAGAASFTATTLRPSKLAMIVLLTRELVLAGDPAGLRAIERDLMAGVVAGTDIGFLDPLISAVAGKNPASVTFGTTATASTGATAAAVEADLAALIASVNGGALVSPVLIMKPETSLALARLKDVGAHAFPDISLTGGSVWGIPVLTSIHAGDYIILIETADLVIADGGVDLDVSTQGSLQLDDAPDDPTVATTTLVSLWSQNLVGLRLVRYLTWAKRTAASAGVISGVTF